METSFEEKEKKQMAAVNDRIGPQCDEQLHVRVTKLIPRDSPNHAHDAIPVGYMSRNSTEHKVYR